MYVHCDLDLWPMTFNINSIHPLTMVNMSAKFDQEAHNGLVAIVFTSLFPYVILVHCNLDLWPPKSIGSILSPWLTVWVWVYWFFSMSHATIFQLYMWRHRCAGGLKKNLYLRLGSQRHRHFVGFFNMTILHWHGTTLFIQLFRETAPFSRLLRHAGDGEVVFST